jgi:molybdopterin-guanine dinucleotide biosynthesis protein A
MPATIKPQPVRNVSPLTGIILAGGQSSRMGQAKGWLPWGEQTLLQHVAGSLAPGLSPLIVVGGKGNELPPLPPGAIIAHDAEPDQGPLLGFQAGLFLAPIDRPIFLTGCDYPFINWDIVRHLATDLKGFDAVVLRDHEQAHPLVAIYQPGIETMVAKTIASGRRSLHALLERLQVRWIENEEWRQVDPSGRVLWNVNTPEEYQAALIAFTSS